MNKKLILLLFLSPLFVFSQNIKGYKVTARQTLIAEEIFIWKTDTIYKDSILYAEVTNDSIRFKNINGGFTNWFYSPKVFTKEITTDNENDIDIGFPLSTTSVVFYNGVLLSDDRWSIIGTTIHLDLETKKYDNLKIRK